MYWLPWNFSPVPSWTACSTPTLVSSFLLWGFMCSWKDINNYPVTRFALFSCVWIYYYIYFRFVFKYITLYTCCALPMDSVTILSGLWYPEQFPTCFLRRISTPPSLPESGFPSCPVNLPAWCISTVHSKVQVCCLCVLPSGQGWQGLLVLAWTFFLEDGSVELSCSAVCAVWKTLGKRRHGCVLVKLRIIFSSNMTVAPTPWIRFDDVIYGGNKPPKPGIPDFQICCAEVILANAVKSPWNYKWLSRSNELPLCHTLSHWSFGWPGFSSYK